MALSLRRIARLFGAKSSVDSALQRSASGSEIDDSAPDVLSFLQRAADGVSFVASSDIELMPDGRTLGFTSDDPWVTLEFSESRTTSALGELTIEAAPVLFDRPLHGKIYLDVGEGYSEASSQALSADGRTTLSLIIAAPSLVRRIRWDPDQGPNEMIITRIAFAPIASQAQLLTRVEFLADAQDRTAALALANFVGPILFAKGLQTGAEAFAVTRRLTQACLKSSMYRRSRETSADYADLADYEVARLRSDVAFLPYKPVFSLITPVFRPRLSDLEAMISSVREQVYPHWELCIADDYSENETLSETLDRYATEDSRIKIVHRESNGHISAASNSALGIATGEWIALLDHDDVLTPDALMRVAQEIQIDPDCEIIYSDEDKLDQNGLRTGAFRKPDFSLELFRSQNYLNHLTAVRTASVRAVGGWRLGYEGSQDHDMLLRVLDRRGAANVRHIPRVLYHWRMSEGSTAVSVDDKSYALTAGIRALEDHLRRLGRPGHVEKTPRLPYYRLRLDLPEPPPRVCLIIPTRDRADILGLCVRSILQRTDYPDFEILIVDNGSVEAETEQLFHELRLDSRVLVVPFDAPFNFSSINNFGVSQTAAPLVAMVNNDIEVISPDWLTEMVSWTVQPDVGCVGAKLYYPNDTIQHAGVIIGLGGVAGHSHKHFPRDSLGYHGRLIVTQDLSAVTAACLLIRRDIFLEVGGLNEKDLKVAFNDVDFCLRVREAGYRNVFTPHAELYHHESASRGAEDDPVKIARFNREVEYMKRRWGRTLVEDPFYSVHLTTAREDFSPA